MSVCNNSSLEWTIEVNSSLRMPIRAQQRISFEDILKFSNEMSSTTSTLGVTKARYIKLSIYQESKLVFTRDALDTQTYVALLGPKPHVCVHFEDDTSEEANTPTPEMIKLVKKCVQAHLRGGRYDVEKHTYEESRYPPFRGEFQYSTFDCYYEVLQSQAYMRPEQMKRAFEEIKSKLAE